MSGLTDKRIHQLAPRAVEYHEWDTLPGFGVRVRPSGHKTYVLFYRPQNRRHQRKLTLGRTDAIAVKDAQRLAREMLGQRGACRAHNVLS